MASKSLDSEREQVIKLIINKDIKYLLFDFDCTLTHCHSDYGEIPMHEIIVNPVFYKELFESLINNNITVGIISFGRYSVIKKYVDEFMGSSNHNIRIFTPRLYDIIMENNDCTAAVFNINNNFTDNEYTIFTNKNNVQILTKDQMIQDFITIDGDKKTVLYYDDDITQITCCKNSGINSINVKQLTEKKFIQYTNKFFI